MKIFSKKFCDRCDRLNFSLEESYAQIKLTKKKKREIRKEMIKKNEEK